MCSESRHTHIGCLCLEKIQSASSVELPDCPTKEGETKGDCPQWKDSYIVFKVRCSVTTSS